MEEASKRLQRELRLERYLSPIVAGTGMGSALAALVGLRRLRPPFRSAPRVTAR
jgi:hypothetical protein